MVKVLSDLNSEVMYDSNYRGATAYKDGTEMIKNFKRGKLTAKEKAEHADLKAIANREKKHQMEAQSDLKLSRRGLL